MKMTNQNGKEIQVIEKNDLPEFMTTIDEAKARYNLLKKFVKFVMTENSDYGVIPGTDKPTLLKPGAEKLNNIYGFYSESEIIEKIEDWDKPFFNYIAKAILYNKRTGIKEAEGIGSCNSMESKFRYRWIFESELTQQQKDDKENLKTKVIFSKKKNRSFKLFRVLNDDLYSQVNTFQKMADKRAFVAATLKATRTSDMFTQDMEDIREFVSHDEPGEDNKKNEKDDIKSALKTINGLRETINMSKEDLAKIVKKQFNETDPFKLTMNQLEDLKDYLETELHNKFDESQK